MTKPNHSIFQKLNQKMTDNEINLLVFDLVSKLQLKKIEREAKKPSGSMGQMPFVDWSAYLVPGPSIVSAPDSHFGRVISVELDGLAYALSKDDYEKFRALTLAVGRTEPFERQVSFDFIEESLFLWMVDVCAKGKAGSDAMTILRKLADENIELVDYFFPIVNLHTDKAFNIGNVTIRHLTKDYFDELWERKSATDPKLDRNIFDGVYRKYQGRTFAVARIEAEGKKGRELAYEECCLALDALKCFTPTVVQPDYPCYVDLAEKLNVNFQVDSLTIPAVDPFEMRITKMARQQPFNVTEEIYHEMINEGMGTFSVWLTKRNKNELSMLTTEALRLFSYAISTRDIHLRVVQLISILEGLLLKEDERSDFEKLVKMRLYSLSREAMEHLDSRQILSALYQVRHKMIHKGKRLTVNHESLAVFQLCLVHVLLRAFELCDSYSTKESLIKSLNNKSK